MIRNRNDRDSIIGKKHGDANALPGEAGYVKPKAKGEAKAKPKAKGEAKAKPKAKGEAQRGRSQSRDGGRGGDDKPVCYFHNHDGCKKDNCNFAHTIVSAKEKSLLNKPSRSDSPGKDGARGGDGGARGGGKGRGEGGKGKGKGGADKKPVQNARQWCAYHLKVEGCTNGDKCNFPHLDVSAVNAIKKAQLAQRG